MTTKSIKHFDSFSEELDAMMDFMSNSEFSKVLDQIKESVKDDMYAEPDEYGITSTPVSYMIAYYEGGFNGKEMKLAKALQSVLADYDIICVINGKINVGASNNQETARLMNQLFKMAA